MLVAGLAAAPPEPPADVPETVASIEPASQASTTEQASVSFRFLTREEGHEVMLAERDHRFGHGMAEAEVAAAGHHRVQHAAALAREFVAAGART